MARRPGWRSASTGAAEILLSVQLVAEIADIAAALSCKTRFAAS
jgi:hypothetical protein